MKLSSKIFLWLTATTKVTSGIEVFMPEATVLPHAITAVLAFFFLGELAGAETSVVPGAGTSAGTTIIIQVIQVTTVVLLSNRSEDKEDLLLQTYKLRYPKGLCG